MNTTRRWLLPMVAALAVLAVIVVGVMVLQRSDGESDAGFADGGSDPGQGAPPHSGSPGSPGSKPGSGGSEEPPAGGNAPDVDSGRIAVASFYRYDGRHLALNYYNGVPECYGDAGVPKVEERAAEVVVWIPRTPPTGSKDTACIDIAVAGSVDVTLSAPLGDRPVLDGAQEETPVKEAAAPHSERHDS